MAGVKDYQILKEELYVVELSHGGDSEIHHG